MVLDDDSYYPGTSDWGNVLSNLLKGTVIVVGLGLSGYFLYLILTS